VDLEQDDAARAFLQTHGILPPDGADFGDQHVDMIHDLTPTTREVLVSFLDRTDPAASARLRRLLRMD
jgi:hypothetical protein